MIKNHEPEHGGHEDHSCFPYGLPKQLGSPCETYLGNHSRDALATPTPDSTNEPMVRKPEMARRLFVTERTVENYMRQRRIPFVKNGRLVFFKPSEVEKALFRKVEPEETPWNKDEGFLEPEFFSRDKAQKTQALQH